MSSCCCGKCGCGSGGSCGFGVCKMYPELSYFEQTTTKTLIMEVAPTKAHFEGVETGVEAGHGY